MRVLKKLSSFEYFYVIWFMWICEIFKFFFVTNLKIIENTQLQSPKYYFYFYSHFPHNQVDKTYFNTSKD